MNIKIGILLAVVALAADFASSARADVPAAPDATTATVLCGDGSSWTVDLTFVDPDWAGQALCDGDYTVLQPGDDSTGPTNAGNDTGDAGDGSWTVADSGGTDVGLGAAGNMDPDPTAYTTEVQCPNGQIWAVASGDYFVCPAA